MAMKMAVYSVPASPSRLVYLSASRFFSRLRGSKTKDVIATITLVRSDATAGKPMD